MHLQDFVECGKVYKCLKNNPDLSNSEVATQTRLPIERVMHLRTYLELEFDLPKTIQSKQVMETRDSIADAEKAVALTKVENPLVTTNMEFTGRITGVDEKGAGVILIGRFKYVVPGGKIGELVKVQVKQVGINECETELIRVLQKSLGVQPLDTKEPIEVPIEGEKADSERNCIKCGEWLKLDDFETNDGLCRECYFEELQNEAARTERRSGTFGADRAGTW